MDSPYKHIGLTAKMHLDNKDAVVGSVMKVLRSIGAEVHVDAKTIGDIPCGKECSRIADVESLDLIIAIGGDGTILRTIRELRPFHAPLLAINAGSVGFLSEIPLADIERKLPELLSGGGVIERRACIEGEIIRNGLPVFSYAALNDVVISQGTISRLLDLKASIGGQFLATYHADGLIVSTPTGSTAYSLAAGGPVLHPVLSALILTPINPHSFTQKPIVIPGDKPIEVTITKGDVPAFENASVGLTVDGQVYQPLQAGDLIVVRTGETVGFLRQNDDAFYRALRTKLKWGEGLDS